MRWDIFVLVIFFIIIFPISLGINITVNAVRNSGTVTIYLFNIMPIYIQKFEMDKGVIKFIKNPKRTHQIKLSFKKNDITNFNNAISIILSSQILKLVKINTKIGIRNSPRIVALISGFYNAVIGNFLSINMAKRNILKSQSSIKTYFRYTYLKTNITLKVKFSIFEVLRIIFQIKLGVKA